MIDQTYPQAGPDLIGRKLRGRFEILGLLKGTSAITACLGRDLAREGAQIVVKCASSKGMATGSMLRLEHEASILASLQQPAIAPILDLGHEEDLVYIVTPFISGISLAERLSTHALSCDEALRLALAMAAALTEVHAQGILHRDIKPSNIIVNAQGPLAQATLIDFGQARHGLSKHPLDEALAFTALYAAPEQTGLIHRGIDERSDLYSLGIVLYESLVGKPPFEAVDLNDVLMQHLSSAPPALRSRVAGLPVVLEDLILRLLAKDPRDRYQSATSLAYDLKTIAQARERGDQHLSFVLGKWDRRESLTEPSFVGRQAELKALVGLVREGSRGKGSVIKVTAPSGAGKSRLLAELARQAQSEGQLVLQGQGLGNAASHPYQILSGIASDVLEASRHNQSFAASLRQQLQDYAPTLCAMMPALTALLHPDLTDECPPEALGENRSLQAVSAFFAALGDSRRSAVLLFDDAQWIDKASAKLLQDWQTRAEEVQTNKRYLSLIFASRSEENTGTPVHPPPWQALRFDHDVALPPLAGDDIAKILRSMAGPLPYGIITKLTEFSAHNPFMATALLRGMVEAGTLRPGANGWRASEEALASLQSSRRAAAILTNRLETFPAPSLQFLSLAAVLGKSFDIDRAVHLAGCPPPEALATLVLARSRHIIWEDHQTGHGHFMHDRLREILIERLPLAERRSLHLRVAELMEAQQASEDFELAYHFDAAGEPARAFPYAMRAAEQARKRYALAVAEQHYRIAERGLAPSQKSEAAALAKELGDVLMLQGRYQEAGVQMQRARELACDKLQRAHIQVGLGELATKCGDMQGAVVALTNGLALLGRYAPQHQFIVSILLSWEILVQCVHSLRLRLRPKFASRRPLDEKTVLALQIYCRLYYAYWFKGTMLSSWAHLRCMNLAERYEESSHLAQAYCDHAVIASVVPWVKRGQTYALRALAIYRHRQDAWGEGRALGFCGGILYVGSRFSEAKQCYEQALAILQRTGDRWTCKLVKWALAHVHYRQGNLQASVEACREVYQESLAIGDFSTTGVVLSIWALASQGQVPADLLANELERNLDDGQTRAALKLTQGVQLLYAGDHMAAIEALEKSVAIVDQAKFRHDYVVHTRLWLMTALRTAADALDPFSPQVDELMAAAARHWRPALKQARSFRTNLPHTLREGALIAAWRRRPGRAHALINTSLDLAADQQAQYEHAQSLEIKGRLGTYFRWPGAEKDRRDAQETLDRLHKRHNTLPSERSADQRGDLSILARFEVILEAGHSIITALSQKAIFEALLGAAAQLFRSQRCLIVTPPSPTAEGDNTFTVMAGNPQQTFSRTLITHALAKGGALAVDETASPTPSDSLLLANVRSALCVPIYRHQVPIACLYVSHPLVGHLFHSAELKLAQFLAILASAALENADGYSKLQSFNETLSQLAAERQKTAEELRDAKEAAEAASRAKSQFLHNMSHEMRTPLVAILGFSHFLASPDLTPDEVSQFLATIDRNGKVLNRLIEDALDLSKAETNMLKVERCRFNLAAFLEHLALPLGRQARDKNIDFRLLPTGKLPETIVSDPNRLQQLLVHVVGNAIKFTADGSVELQVSLSEPRASSPVQALDKRAMLCFTVKDTGCGITPEAQAKLFQPFMQADASHTRLFSGSGMGLYLSSKIAKALGGRIELTQSTPRSGSVFTILIDPNALGALR